MVFTMSKLNAIQLLSTMHFNKRWKNDEMLYLATLEEEDVNVSSNLPKEIIDVLNEYENAMPPKLPKEQPPRREVDIKLS